MQQSVLDQTIWFAILGYGLMIPAIFYKIFTQTFEKQYTWIGSVLLLIGYSLLFTYAVYYYKHYVKQPPDENHEKKKSIENIKLVGHIILFLFFFLAFIFEIIFKFEFFDFFAIIGHVLLIPR